MKKKEISIDNLEKKLVRRCNVCFYCCDETAGSYVCNKINKYMFECPAEAETCSFFLSYWDVFDIVEGGLL
jgi:hypothetical protein